MRTARSYSVSGRGALDRDPRGHWDPLDRKTPGQKNPRTETPCADTLPGQRTPWTKFCQKTTPPDVNRITCAGVKTLPSRNFVCGAVMNILNWELIKYEAQLKDTYFSRSFRKECLCFVLSLISTVNPDACALWRSFRFVEQSFFSSTGRSNFALKYKIECKYRFWNKLNNSFTKILLYNMGLVVTVRNEVAKVMFLHVSVILYQRGVGGYAIPACLAAGLRGGLGGGGCLLRGEVGWQTPPPPDQQDSHCRGRYASYWNAFLFP